jgi:hypothetical protein
MEVDSMSLTIEWTAPGQELDSGTGIHDSWVKQYFVNDFRHLRCTVMQQLSIRSNILMYSTTYWKITSVPSL